MAQSEFGANRQWFGGWRLATRALTGAGLAALLASCGGGGGSAGVCKGSAQVCFPSSGSPSYSGVLSPNIPSEQVAGYCEASAQKQFMRSYFNETYLWSSEVPEVNSTPYAPEGYFYQLRVTTPDVLGLPKDRFSFVVDNSTADTIATGIGASFGVSWVNDANGVTRVAQVAAGSPAAAAGLARGGILVAVLASSHNTWYPANPGETITFSYKANAAAAATTVTLTSAGVTEDPVPTQKIITTGSGRRVGYVLFNAFTTGAQDKLITTLSSMATAGIQDLVLDLRYNSGGFVYTAVSLSSMVTGPVNDGKVAQRLQFNSARAEESAASVYRFSGKVEYGEVTHIKGASLPRLNLPRLYILSSGDTCSASELVINSLRGVDVQVILVGGTTCGKPYGFSRQDNCGLSLYPIEFQGLNAKDFGDYMNGFAATCPAPDDFDRALGDPTEGLLGRALSHADTGVCTPAVALEGRRAQGLAPATGLPLEVRRNRPGLLLTP